MKLQPLFLMLGIASAPLSTFAADTPADDMNVYQQKMDQCTTQLATDHPDMTAKQRKKACRAQLGPAPKGVVPAKAPAPVF